MTDPTTQATRVDQTTRIKIDGSWFENILVVGDSGYHDLTILQTDNRVVVPFNQGERVASAIDTISGGEYRARIERETIERLAEGAADKFLRTGDWVPGVAWDIVHWLRAQQPSDQTQGVDE